MFLKFISKNVHLSYCLNVSGKAYSSLHWIRFVLQLRSCFRVVDQNCRFRLLISNNQKDSAGNRKTNAGFAQLHLQERGVILTTHGDLPLTSGILYRGSASQNERTVADWPLPPGYSGMHGDTSQEMDDLRPAVPHTRSSSTTQGKAPLLAAPMESHLSFPSTNQEKY